MLEKIDHIGIAVKDLKVVLETFQNAFGLQPEFMENVADQRVNVAGFKIGESVIEYLEPTSADSPLNHFLQSRNNGIHHISYSVKNIEEKLHILKEKGFRLIDEYPKIGANGKKIAFLHPKSFNGILIELCEV
jgi:methylmalonyl-CoA/ethylmalonyl-CoA epimerase